MKFSKLAGNVIAAFGLLAVGAPAVAGVTLVYTGPRFTSISTPAAGTGIFGYVVLRDYNPAVEQAPDKPDVLDWSISNGAFTLSRAGGNFLQRFDMRIVPTGHVVAWAFDAQDLPDWTKFSRTESEYNDLSIVKDNSYSGESENGGSSGSWTVANSVPEPAAWAMMLVGFGAMGATMRSRRTAAFRPG